MMLCALLAATEKYISRISSIFSITPSEAGQSGNNQIAILATYHLSYPPASIYLETTLSEITI